MENCCSAHIEALQKYNIKYDVYDTFRKQILLCKCVFNAKISCHLFARFSSLLRLIDCEFVLSVAIGVGKEYFISSFFKILNYLNDIHDLLSLHPICYGELTIDII